MGVRLTVGLSISGVRYVFFVVEAETSQLPSINAFVKGDYTENTQFLQEAHFVPEAAVSLAAAKRQGEPVQLGILAQEALRLSSTGSLDLSLFPEWDRFWAMQLMGLAPWTAIATGFKRLRLTHSPIDRQFATMMRLWLAVFLIVPAVIGKRAPLSH